MVGFLANPGRFSWIDGIRIRQLQVLRRSRTLPFGTPASSTRRRGLGAWRLGTALKNWTGLENHEILIIENDLKLNMEPYGT